jgi:hypothetical protein
MSAYAAYMKAIGSETERHPGVPSAMASRFGSDRSMPCATVIDAIVLPVSPAVHPGISLTPLQNKASWR